MDARLPHRIRSEGLQDTARTPPVSEAPERMLHVTNGRI